MWKYSFLVKQTIAEHHLTLVVQCAGLAKSNDIVSDFQLDYCCFYWKTKAWQGCHYDRKSECLEWWSSLQKLQIF